MENKLFLEVAVNNQSPSLFDLEQLTICFVLKWWVLSSLSCRQRTNQKPWFGEESARSETPAN